MLYLHGSYNENGVVNGTTNVTANVTGSWHQAPYLDRHGEADYGLKRNRQLILNQKRYDRLLRDVWLSNSIPTTISRKLEADSNQGGWESL